MTNTLTKKKTQGRSIMLVSAPGFAHGWSPLNIARIKSFLREKGYYTNTMPLCVYFTDYIIRHHPRLKKLDEEIGEFGYTWHEVYFSTVLFGHAKPEKLIMKSVADMHSNKDIFYTRLNCGKNGDCKPDISLLKADCRRIMRYCKLMHRFLLGKIQAVAWEKYDVVGFSVLEAQFLTSLFIARYIKEHYGKKPAIVFGGAFFQPYNIRPILNNFREIDHIVAGDAEKGLLDFLEKFRRKTKLPRTSADYASCGSSKKPAILSIDEMNKFPPPDYSEIKAKKASNYSLTTYMGAGCSHSSCSFCPIVTSGQNLRSPQRILKEIKFLLRRYGQRSLYFGDWEINGDLKTIEQLCDLLIKNRISIDSWAEMNARNTSPALMRKMKKVGMNSAQIGIESFSDRMLRIMGKRATVLDNVKVLKWGIEGGMDRMLFNIICNHPLCCAEDVEENLRIMRFIPHLLSFPVEVVLNEIELYRTSRLFQNTDKFRISGIRDFEYYRRLYPRKFIKNQIPMFNLAFRGLPLHPAWKRIENYLAKIKRRPVTLSARKVRNGLLVYDSRNYCVKRYKLYGLEADVLLASMDAIRNTNELQQMLNVSSDRIIASVNRLTRKGLMLKNGSGILSLPLKAGAL